MERVHGEEEGTILSGPRTVPREDLLQRRDPGRPKMVRKVVQKRVSDDLTSSVTLLHNAYAIPSKLSTNSCASTRSKSGGSDMLRVRVRAPLGWTVDPLGIGEPRVVKGRRICETNEDCKTSFDSARRAKHCCTLESEDFLWTGIVCSEELSKNVRKDKKSSGSSRTSCAPPPTVIHSFRVSSTSQRTLVTCTYSDTGAEDPKGWEET